MVIQYPRRMVLAAVILVIVAVILAFFVAEVLLPPGSVKLKETIETATIGLIFGATLGGVIKLLLEDLDRGRAQRADQAQFVTNILTDLKAVYDRVERARILLAAHKSAKTYGDEMRDLIDSRVKLLNVIRALDTRTADLVNEKAIRDAVKVMENYMARLMEEFRDHYKGIADMQRAHEVLIETRLKTAAADATVDGTDGFVNEAWQAILTLPHVVDFASLGPHPETHTPTKTIYEREFQDSLDTASANLREELRMILSGA